MEQLLREWPPGFGGVERVAHGLASVWSDPVYVLLAPLSGKDPLPVPYARSRLRSLSWGRLILPLPCRPLLRLLVGREPLLAHLPCPTVLALALVARLLHPKRKIVLLWHSFLMPRVGWIGWLEGLYQWIALQCGRWFFVITTSPVLQQSLERRGFRKARLAWLSCVLPSQLEQSYEQIWNLREQSKQSHGRVIAIGRLDSYKRIDWLIKAFASVPAARELLIVGDGPDRSSLERLAVSLECRGQTIRFLGRVDERRKHELLAQADVLVLSADRCNEAFGIVQLEAMACGVPALAFSIPDSGMHWVSRIPSLDWPGNHQGLSQVLQRLFSEPALYQKACQESRQRYVENFSQSVWRSRLQQLAMGFVDA